MNKVLNKKIKKLIPPILFDLYVRIFYKKNQNQEYGWIGNYSTWEKASKHCDSYSSNLILEKVKDSLLKVKNHKAVYERDSVLFDEIQYSWALLATLLKIGAEQAGKLHIVDFGGSLGSTYYQNKDFLSVIKDIRWNIVEQKHFVDVGKVEFQDDNLNFYYSINECLEQCQCDILLLSSVLQYLENPLRFIDELMTQNFKYIIIDRTAFTHSIKSFVTTQRVPPEIYNASYPCWFFNENKLMEVFQNQYIVQYSFDALDVSNIENTYFKGFVLKSKIC